MEKDYFPKNLKYLINTGKISVKTILQITGNNSPGLVTMWKNGERQITTKDLISIANYLNYTIDDLINKDLSTETNKIVDNLDILYKKSKDIMSEETKSTIEFLMKKTIDNYEKSKSNKE